MSLYVYIHPHWGRPVLTTPHTACSHLELPRQTWKCSGKNAGVTKAVLELSIFSILKSSYVGHPSTSLNTTFPGLSWANRNGWAGRTGEPPTPEMGHRHMKKGFWKGDAAQSSLVQPKAETGSQDQSCWWGAQWLRARWACAPQSEVQMHNCVNLPLRSVKNVAYELLLLDLRTLFLRMKLHYCSLGHPFGNNRTVGYNVFVLSRYGWCSE